MCIVVQNVLCVVYISVWWKKSENVTVTVDFGFVVHCILQTPFYKPNHNPNNVIKCIVVSLIQNELENSVFY